jgi:uncharacterized protein YqgC (DUF456 family)
MTDIVLLWILAAILVAVGLSGLVLPALPGPPLLFAGFLVAAWAENFAYVGTGTLIALGVMAVLMYVVDLAATAFGAKRFGASKRAALGAAIGALLGLFFGIVGVLIGPFVGAVIGELTVRPDLRAASRAGVGASVGLAIGAAAKLALAVAMLGVFLVVRFA